MPASYSIAYIWFTDEDHCNQLSNNRKISSGVWKVLLVPASYSIAYIWFTDEDHCNQLSNNRKISSGVWKVLLVPASYNIAYLVSSSRCPDPIFPTRLQSTLEKFSWR